MKDAAWRRTDMHAAVLLFLFSLRELHPELETSPQAWADFNKWCRGGGA